jgi:predicted phage terminase large subunit-like protein
MNRIERNQLYNQMHDEAESLGQEQVVELQRFLCRTDLFYLLTRGCGRDDINKDWLFDRCQEVQAGPNGFLDLWAREHYKSTIITFGKSIQDILASHGDDPLPEWAGLEVTIGIFSHTKAIARGFLKQIKTELENNERLKVLFPDILYQDPKKQAPSWSEENGITVKRKSNPKEATVEGWGLVDGQPTSKHFLVLVYDDVVTRESVTTAEQIKKTTEAWELSLNLGADGGVKRYIGTRYHFNDSYRTIIERGSATPRIYPATDNGDSDGNPVFLSRESLTEKRRDMGVFVFGCQMLQNPQADQTQGFKAEWLRYYDTEPDPATVNFYTLVDPANEKKKESDHTAMWVIGLGADRNYYIYDIVYDRLNLTERTNKLFELHRDYLPLGVGYEHYGMQADIQHIESEMERIGYRFNVTKLGGNTPKPDRIRRLVPKFEQGKIWLPRSLWYTDCEGKRHNLVKRFVDEEYTPFPVAAHDDLLDGLARILDHDLAAQFPTVRKREKKESWQEKLRRKTGAGRQSGSHMTA